ncbi:MAG: hypothetical protein QOG76_4974, partial [Pseudonocardiales bacterium]|nr:hypothetical protein [Pseudonocardiales bacterium]
MVEEAFGPVPRGRVVPDIGTALAE